LAMDNALRHARRAILKTTQGSSAMQSLNFASGEA